MDETPEVDATEHRSCETTTHGSVFDALLASATRLSFDPRKLSEEANLDDTSLYGMSAQWSILYNTPTWQQMTHRERVNLTRCEVSHYLATAVWLEVALQVSLLRRHHSADPTRADVKFLLNECADECLHSLMFVNAIDGIGQRYYPRDRSLTVLGWLFRTFAWDDIAYGIVLAGEELFDGMQRDWMADAQVSPVIRNTSYIHVVEESRHMAFSRHKLRDSLSGASRVRRWISTIFIAIGTHLIAKSLVNPAVYRSAGLDWKRIKPEIDANEHHRMMFRRGAEPLVEFLNKERLLNPAARWIYRTSNLL